MVDPRTARYKVVWLEDNPAYVPGPGWIPEDQWREPACLLRSFHTDDRHQMRARVNEHRDAGRVAVGYHRHTVADPWVPTYTTGHDKRV